MWIRYAIYLSLCMCVSGHKFVCVWCVYGSYLKWNREWMCEQERNGENKTSHIYFVKGRIKHMKIITAARYSQYERIEKWYKLSALQLLNIDDGCAAPTLRTSQAHIHTQYLFFSLFSLLSLTCTGMSEHMTTISYLYWQNATQV